MTLDNDIRQVLFAADNTPLPAPPAGSALHRLLDRWSTIHEYQTTIWPFYPTATRVVVELSSEYNDEGGYYDCISSVSVYDASGADLTDEFEDDHESDRAYEWSDLKGDLSIPSYAFAPPGSYGDREVLLTAGPLMSTATREDIMKDLTALAAAVAALPDTCFPEPT